jgi:hypothetical protein
MTDDEPANVVDLATFRERRLAEVVERRKEAGDDDAPYITIFTNHRGRQRIAFRMMEGGDEMVATAATARWWAGELNRLARDLDSRDLPVCQACAKHGCRDFHPGQRRSRNLGWSRELNGPVVQNVFVERLTKRSARLVDMETNKALRRPAVGALLVEDRRLGAGAGPRGPMTEVVAIRPRIPMRDEPWPASGDWRPCPVCKAGWRPWRGSRLPCHASCLYRPDDQDKLLKFFQAPMTPSVASVAEKLGGDDADPARQRRGRRPAPRLQLHGVAMNVAVMLTCEAHGESMWEGHLFCRHCGRLQHADRLPAACDCGAAIDHAAARDPWVAGSGRHMLRMCKKCWKRMRKRGRVPVEFLPHLRPN